MARILFPGDTGPLGRTPDRQPGSIRRTMTVDGDRPDGPRGDVVISGRGRDLLTYADGSAAILANERLQLRADFVTDQAVKEVFAEPGDRGLVALVGLASRRGFRAGAADRMPHRRDDGSLLMMLFDDVPIVTSLSRMALHRRGAVSLSPTDPNYLGNRGTGETAATWTGFQVQCAGWAPGTTMTLRAEAGVRAPVSDGLPSPPILREDDPIAWHDVASLPPDGFRRWRRTDVWRSGPEGSVISVDAWWRDTYVAADGDLLIVHEYSVALTVDAGSGVVLTIDAEPRVLPGPECNQAAASATRLVGHPLTAIGQMVRNEFAGSTTCTHLNDELHSLADLHALVPQLPPPTGRW